MNKAILPDAGTHDEVLLRIRIPEELHHFTEERDVKPFSFYELREALGKISENRI